MAAMNATQIVEGAHHARSRTEAYLSALTDPRSGVVSMTRSPRPKRTRNVVRMTREELALFPVPSTPASQATPQPIVQPQSRGLGQRSAVLNYVATVVVGLALGTATAGAILQVPFITSAATASVMIQDTAEVR